MKTYTVTPRDSLTSASGTALSFKTVDRKQKRVTAAMAERVKEKTPLRRVKNEFIVFVRLREVCGRQRVNFVIVVAAPWYCLWEEF